MSRKVYDACRRYKHFYKKHEDVKSWNSKYHDIDLTQAVAKTKAQLNECRDDLLAQLFREYDVQCTTIESRYDDPFWTMGRCIPVPNPYKDFSTTDVEFKGSRLFLELLAKHMISREWSNEW